MKNALIIGGGTISYYLAKTLIDTRIHVKIIEKDPNRCEFLSDLLPDATIINGDGTDRALLLEEGLELQSPLLRLPILMKRIFFSLCLPKKAPMQSSGKGKPSALYRRH